MKKLRTYYERELGTLQEFNREFAAEYPAQAQRLNMANGVVADPHIERFIQATALSNARIAQLIDDNDAKVTEAFLSVNYPHYLQPFPAAAIVCADRNSVPQTRSAPIHISRGSMMSARVKDAQVCKFRSTFDVSLPSLSVASFAFKPIMDLPNTLPRHPDAISSLCIGIECAGSEEMKQVKLDALRLFIDAEQSQCATIRDALFMHVQGAYLEVDGFWVTLDRVPIIPVGFDAQDALIPYKATAHPAFRLLSEYFVFPEKFNFFDINWPTLAAHIPPSCRILNLHLALTGMPLDSPMARRLAMVSSKNLVLGCTPVVNLFKRHAVPVQLVETETDYALVPDAAPANAYDIYSVDKVTMLQESHGGLTEFRPYYSMRHGEAGGNRGRYYLVRRDPVRAVSHPGYETRISLVDLTGDPVISSNASVSIELTCTNRDPSSLLHYGEAEGDLELEGAASGYPLRFLRRPSMQYRFERDTHWRLMSLLSTGSASLQESGLNGLKEVLTLYDLPQSAVTQRQIAGLMALEYRPATAWLRDGLHSTPVHGLEIRLAVDADAFAGTGLHLFSQVLDHFFGLLVRINCFSQLIVLSHLNGKELLRCPPRHGATRLI